MLWRVRIVIALVVCCGLAAWADTLIIAGRTYTLETPFVLERDEVLAPIGPALRLLGASVTTDGNRVTLTAGAHTFTSTLNGTTARADDRSLKIAAPRYLDDTLYLPAKAVARWLGQDPHFDAETHTLAFWPVVTVTHEACPAGIALLVRSSGPIQYTSGRLSDPPRAFIDLKGVSLGVVEQQFPVAAGLVERVRMSQYAANPAVVRLVVDLRGEAALAPTVSDAGRLLTVLVSEPVAMPSPAVTPTPTPLPGLQPLPGPMPYQLLDLTLNQQSAQQSELCIVADNPVAIQAKYSEKTRVLQLQFANGRLSIPTEKFANLKDGVVERVVARVTPEQDTVLEVTLKKDAGYLLQEEATAVRVLLGTFSIKDMCVVLDAGHGGADTGAIGACKTLEKTINLDVALRAKKLLESAGAKVLLTRSGDTYPTLDERPALANTSGADVFISIHCNSSAKRNSAQGIETYYTTPRSRDLASFMHAELLRTLERKNRGVHERSLKVTRLSKMPAVLLELAFINNSVEEQLLASTAYRQRAAEAILNGLRRYAASRTWRLHRGLLGEAVTVAATEDLQTMPVSQ